MQCVTVVVMLQIETWKEVSLLAVDMLQKYIAKRPVAKFFHVSICNITTNVTLHAKLI
jgi:hypothetical protein